MSNVILNTDGIQDWVSDEEAPKTPGVVLLAHQATVFFGGHSTESHGRETTQIEVVHPETSRVAAPTTMFATFRTC